MSESETCDNCKFLDRSNGYEDSFVCRRFPPQISAWSHVKVTEWCGEYAPPTGQPAQQ